MTIAPFPNRKRALVPSSDSGDAGDGDAYIFETPTDLLCPITHELFHEPVINAAGQVYERAAIEKALAHRLVDPISNLPLETAALTTVWPMKSKAAAYRERAVRGCVAQVCKPTCRNPIRYLRRAAELSSGVFNPLDANGAVLGLPGLTSAVVDYVLTHPSSIYDFQALSRFAASLLTSGHRDLAAGVYTKLLQLGGDTAQQVEALVGLLDCWAQEADTEGEQRLVERLAALSLSCGEDLDGCRPARFANVLLAAGLPEDVVLRFCEYILGGCGSGPCAMSRSEDAEQRGAGGTVAAALPAVSAPGDVSGYADLLYVYTRLRCGRLEAAIAQGRSGGAVGAPGSVSREDGKAAPAASQNGCVGRQDGKGDGKGRCSHMARRRHLQRAVCSAVYALMSLSGSKSPLVRVLKVASVLWLVNPPKGPQ